MSVSVYIALHIFFDFVLLLRFFSFFIHVRLLRVSKRVNQSINQSINQKSVHVYLQYWRQEGWQTDHYEHENTSHSLLSAIIHYFTSTLVSDLCTRLNYSARTDTARLLFGPARLSNLIYRTGPPGLLIFRLYTSRISVTIFFFKMKSFRSEH